MLFFYLIQNVVEVFTRIFPGKRYGNQIYEKQRHPRRARFLRVDQQSCDFFFDILVIITISM